MRRRRVRSATTPQTSRRGPPGGRRSGCLCPHIRYTDDGHRRRSVGRSQRSAPTPTVVLTVAMVPPMAKTKSVAITGTTSHRPRPWSRRRTCANIQTAMMASAGGQTQLSRSIAAGPGWSTIRLSPTEPRTTAGTAIQVWGWALYRVVRPRHETPAEPEGEQHGPGDDRLRTTGRRSEHEGDGTEGAGCERAEDGKDRRPLAGGVRESGPSGGTVGDGVFWIGDRSVGHLGPRGQVGCDRFG